MTQKDTETKVILAHFLYSKTSERHMYVCLFPPLLSQDCFRAIVLSSFDDFNSHTQSHQRQRERKEKDSEVNEQRAKHIIDCED